MEEKRNLYTLARIGIMAVLDLFVMTASLHARIDRTSSNVAQFDAVIELDASRRRTHVVLFARYWVTADSYRMAVVWAEPHAGHFNFPLYPPTLNVASDPNRFMISHQFQHMYDGAFAKPIGERGPFRHQFNAYYLSDIRFAESEAVVPHIDASDLHLHAGKKTQREEVLDLSSKTGGEIRCDDAAQARIRLKRGRPSEVNLFDQEGNLLKAIAYEYTETGGHGTFQRQRVVLPEQPIVVAFDGQGPTITVAGETREYSSLETVHHNGGRQCTVDYEGVTIRGRETPMPSHIAVCSGDQADVLRSARLCNFVSRRMTAEEIEAAARRFGAFDPCDVRCRELFLKYWMKPFSVVSQLDSSLLHDLRSDLRHRSSMGSTIGEQLKRINTLLQLDWMLDDSAGIESDFRQYLSLLSGNGLDRMVLVGGQNAIEITFRWGKCRVASGLLSHWLDTATGRNDPNSLLELAAGNIGTRRFWTTARLMERMLADPGISADQRFAAQAYHCIAMANICQMVRDPDHCVTTELDAAQVQWVIAQDAAESLAAETSASLNSAWRTFSTVAHPTREHLILKSKLDTIEKVFGDRRINDEISQSD